MIRISSCVLALLVSANLAVAGPNGQNPPTRGSQEGHNSFMALVAGNVPTVTPSSQEPSTRGSQEHNPTPQTKRQSAGFTLDKLQGLPMVRTPAVSQMYLYQPYSYYGVYPYSFNSAYSYPHSYGLGGYYPPGAGGRGGWGWGGWGLGWWW